ncbi:PEP-CTERM sorting domain-containing protein [Roseibacillus persicicus]|uniref:PEP-CTERM sorting domain-containing protein n=1 Tax=Roseibacillus persicicus TaxID=454148 RepID=UPI00398B2E6C
MRIISTMSLFTVLGVTLPTLSHGALALTPTWENDPFTTETHYTFTTDNKTAPPEEFRNENGTPSLAVVDDPVFGAGWQRPNTIDAARTPDSGAWDMGQGEEGVDGYLSISVPLGSRVGLSSQELNIFVEFIWFSVAGIATEPLFFLEGATPITSIVEREQVAVETLSTWERTVWQASFSDFSSDIATLTLQAPTGQGSVIEEVNIYTISAAPIPEPGTMAFLAVGLMGFLRRRR